MSATPSILLAQNGTALIRCTDWFGVCAELLGWGIMFGLILLAGWALYQALVHQNSDKRGQHGCKDIDAAMNALRAATKRCQQLGGGGDDLDGSAATFSPRTRPRSDFLQSN